MKIASISRRESFLQAKDILQEANVAKGAAAIGKGMSSIQLLVCKHPSHEEEASFDLKRLSVGRDPKNEIVLNDSDVSRVHCTIYFEKDKWRVKDLQSTNGTYLNGVPVKDHFIKPGDVIIVGKCRIHYLHSAAGVQATAAESGEERTVHKIDPQSSLLWAHEQETIDVDNTEVNQFRSAINVLRRGYSYLSPMFLLDEISRRDYSTEDLTVKAAQSIMDIFPNVDFCSISLMHAKTQEAQQQVTVSFPPELAQSIKIDTRLCDQVIKERLAMLVETRLNPDDENSKAVQVMCAPLLAGNHCIGYLYAGSQNDEEVFSKIDLELYSLFALHLAISFDNLINFRRIRKRCDDLLSTADRASLLQQILMGKERHAQLNTVAGINLGDLLSIMRKVKECSEKMEKNIPEAHPARADMEMLSSEIDIATSKLDHLLMYCRRGKIHITRFHPTKLIDEIIDLTKGILGENIWVDADIPDDLPLLEFDGVLFEQILVRLMIIARNAMIEGGMLKINANAMEFDEEFVKSKKPLRQGPGVHISIETTGGLDISIQEKGEYGIDREDYDTLVMVKEIAQANQASIEVEPGKTGSRIHLYFHQSAV